MSQINDLVNELHAVAKSKGWYDPPRTPVETHMLIVSEIAEATECVRVGEPACYVSDSGKPEGEAVELADAVIRIMDYFGYKGWDLEAVLKLKMEYNKSRSHRHGNKSC